MSARKSARERFIKYARRLICPDRTAMLRRDTTRSAKRKPSITARDGYDMFRADARRYFISFSLMLPSAQPVRARSLLESRCNAIQAS